MKILTISGLLIAAVLASADDTQEAASSALHTTVVSDTDDMQDITWYNIKAYTCNEGGDCPALSNRTPIEVYFGAKNKRRLPLRVRFETVNDDWKYARVITLKLNGKLYRVSTSYGEWKRDVWAGGECHEVLDTTAKKYPALGKLCMAREVKVRIEGEGGIHDYTLSPEQVEAVHTMCKAHATWPRIVKEIEARNRKEAEEAEARTRKAAEESEARSLRLAQEARDRVERVLNDHQQASNEELIRSLSEFVACLEDPAAEACNSVANAYWNTCQKFLKADDCSKLFSEARP